MPTKFRRTIFIKRGDYVVVEDIEEGDKVKAEIVHILFKENIKYLREQQRWSGRKIFASLLHSSL